MGALHAGMQRSLEMMKEMVRTGEGPDRHPVEQHLPIIVLKAVGFVVLVVLFLRFLAWLF
jgi:hypothetical protein